MLTSSVTKSVDQSDQPQSLPHLEAVPPSAVELSGRPAPVDAVLLRQSTAPQVAPADPRASSGAELTESTESTESATVQSAVPVPYFIGVDVNVDVDDAQFKDNHGELSTITVPRPTHRRPKNEHPYLRMSDVEIQYALTLHKQGVSIIEVSRRLKRPFETIRKTLARWEPTVELARAVFQRDAVALAEKVMSSADVDQGLEIMDRLEVLTKRDKVSDNRVQVVIGLNVDDIQPRYTLSDTPDVIDAPAVIDCSALPIDVSDVSNSKGETNA